MYVTQKHIKLILANTKYNIIDTSALKYRIKYNALFGIQNDDWENIFQVLHNLTIDNKAKEFQYKNIMRCILTNYLLHKMDKLTSQNCSFCNLEPEKIEHFFIRV